MPDLLLTMHCATHDAEVVIAALQPLLANPLHIWPGTVRGADFTGASTGEKVNGERLRTSIEAVISFDALPALLKAVADTDRHQAVEWRTIALNDHGKIA